MIREIGVVIKRIYPEGRLCSAKRFKKGIINKTYDIKIKNPNKQLVLRFYPKDFWKAKKEKYLYNLISKKTDIPTPNVITSGKNYLLISKVQGKELSLTNKPLIKEAGKILAKLHSIKLPSYGWIINREIKPKFNSWDKFVMYDLKEKLRKIPDKDQKLKKQIAKLVAENKDLLNPKTTPCLLHKDFHRSHILVNNNRISGIIDLEWAIAGHNELDIAKSCLWMFEKRPELEKTFLEGYRKLGSVSRQFKKRKPLYRLLIHLSSLSFSYECKNKKWCVYNMKKLEDSLDEHH